MVLPTLEDFSRAAEKANVIPVFVEVPADLETPLSVYLKLKQAGPSFILESVQQGESVGRYSFVGIGPRWLMRLEGKSLSVWRPDQDSGLPLVQELTGDAFSALEELLVGFRAADVDGLPRFWGGAVGYFGYDAIREVEPRLNAPLSAKAGAGQLPRACFVYSRTSVLFDHVRQRMFIVVAAVVSPDKDVAASYREAVAELSSVQQALARPLPYPQGGCDSGEMVSGRGELRFHSTNAEFCEAVAAAKQHIAAGDIFQVVLSQRVSRPTHCNAVSLYRALRLKNPSPYMLLLDFEEFQLIGASPEMLVKLEGDVANTRPIAGTRPRSAIHAEDVALEKELLEDPKERAEHVMLVDLGRNDLGRVCRYGTVEVPQFMEVERFSHVMHIVSLVEGRLRPDSTGLQLLKACFPAGTVSGAPKVRAMEIIDSLESLPRGPYAGAVGTFSFSGDVNTCITIRTMWKIGHELYLQAGAGIVADSDPQAEYRETLAKLEGLLSAVDLAEQEFEPRTPPPPSGVGSKKESS